MSSPASGSPAQNPSTSPPPGPSDETPASGGLRPVVGTWALYLFILGDVLGAGVYVLVGQVARIAGGAVWVPLLVALLMALLTAGSYAELATKYPRAGGSSHYARLAFGPFMAFLVGFCMLAAGVVSVGALALGFAGDYLAEFVHVPTDLAAVVFLAALALLNMRGIKESIGANSVATVIEVSGLLLVLVLGIWVIAHGHADLSRLTHLGTPQHHPAAAVLSASVLAFYSYVGFETSVNVAEEARDPQRSYPRALFGALLTAGVIYVGVGVAASSILPTDRLAASSGPLLEVVRAAGGVPPVVFSIIALVAVSNGALLTGIMSSRLVYGMARDGLMPRVFARLLPGRRTPWVAILATTAVSMLLALTGGIDSLAGTLVLLLLVVFSSVNVAVLVLRRRPVDHQHFTIPAVFPMLGLASCVLLATRVEASTWRIGIPVLVVGVLLAAWSARRNPDVDITE